MPIMYTIINYQKIYLLIFILLLIFNTIQCYLTRNQNEMLLDWNVIDNPNEAYMMKLPAYFAQTPFESSSSSSSSASTAPSALSSFWSYYFADGEPKRNGHYSQRLGK
ncbi:unnamed protein product [Schistosoma turkestanicum]|nr:unnamed protein product [Schistosoma turkestanicum]